MSKENTFRPGTVTRWFMHVLIVSTSLTCYMTEQFVLMDVNMSEMSSVKIYHTTFSLIL